MIRRIQKVRELIQQEIAKMILETIPQDLGLVTVTEVDVSPDLKNAKIFISCFEEKSQKQVLKKLDEENINFQRLLGKKLKTRNTPKLEYTTDTSLDKINKIEELLTKIEDN